MTDTVTALTVSERIDAAIAPLIEPLHLFLVSRGWIDTSSDHVAPAILAAAALLGAAAVLLRLTRRRRQVKLDGPLSDLVRGPIVMGGLAGLLLVAVLSGWSAFAPLASAAVAPGVISADEQRQTIQHLEGGIIRDIHVREGDHVQAGDPLVTLDDTMARARQTEILERFAHLLATEARLKSERDGSETILFPADLRRTELDRVPELIDEQVRLFLSRNATMESREKILSARIDQLSEQSRGLRDVIGAQERQVSLLDEDIDATQTLLDRGLERRPKLLALLRERAEVEAELASARARVAEIAQRIGETEIQRLALREEYAERSSAELLETQRELAELRSQLPTRSDQLARTVIRAPLTGTVINVVATTQSGVVRPGDALMQIVPDGLPLLVDARVRPTDIDRVAAGMRARVVLSAFKQRNLPLIFGIVQTVSADVLTDDNSGEAYYLARVEIDAGDLSVLDPELLSSGMPAEVLILEEEKTLVEYLADPIRMSLFRSFRED